VLMSREDKMELRRKAKFLEDMGYVVREDEYGLAYDSSKIRFDFSYERYGSGTELNIIFKEINEGFDVGWIAVVRENLNLRNVKPKDEISICIAFIKENYDKLMDMRYCQESRAMIPAHLERMRTQR